MENILGFYAQTHTAYLHANGLRSTAFLIEKMNSKPGQRILEIGFGTGQTLVELSCRFEGVELFGLEKSPQMLAAARRRFEFAGLSSTRFLVMPASLDCPFPEGFFDLIYAESVLSILPDEDLEKIWREMFRLLRPEGSVFFNESLWRDGVSPEKIKLLNQQCMAWFGIPQASGTHPYPSDWERLAERHGFRVLERTPLSGIRARLPWRFDWRLFRSGIFSVLGKIKSHFYPSLRGEKKRIEQQVKLFASEPPFLEGIFFHCKKTAV